MHIALISILTPASENIRGTSALPYHILLHRDRSIDVTLYSYNFNELSEDKITAVSKELKVTINILPKPWWLVWMFRMHLLILRLVIPYPIHSYIRIKRLQVQAIKDIRPDGIWVYGEELYRVVKQFEGYKRIHTLPDCESLYYYRMLGKHFVTSSISFYYRIAFMYSKFLRMERNFPTDSTVVHHLVGEEDAKHLKEQNPLTNVVFVRHPHYETKEVKEDTVHFHQPKIKLLIAGQNNIYMRQTADELFEELKNCRIEELKNSYTFTFLGKGWERHVEMLREAGYEVHYITFAPNYIEEICKHDIQITPIAIGTGTKGKVLDALANGLLVIGTPYAIENIAVRHEESCIEYRQPKELIEVLMDIPKNILKYEKIAEEGRRQVLTLHSRSVISKQLFDLFEK